MDRLPPRLKKKRRGERKSRISQAFRLFRTCFPARSRIAGWRFEAVIGSRVERGGRVTSLRRMREAYLVVYLLSGVFCSPVKPTFLSSVSARLLGTGVSCACAAKPKNIETTKIPRKRFIYDLPSLIVCRYCSKTSKTHGVALHSAPLDFVSLDARLDVTMSTPYFRLPLASITSFGVS